MQSAVELGKLDFDCVMLAWAVYVGESCEKTGYKWQNFLILGMRVLLIVWPA